ncbi:MAG: acetate kinase [Proteobacteria bacterium]|nr:acetate kinase [Pseudomonadota bacterium]
MKVLVLNTGSSSAKYRLFDMRGDLTLARGAVERIGESESRLVHQARGGDSVVRAVAAPDHRAALAKIVDVLGETGALRNPDELHAVGHRVVHGGERFCAPVLITRSVLEGIEALQPLAPLHNPANCAGIEVALELAPQVPQVAVFDTAFHRTLPRHAYLYALPYRLYEDLGVRRYGFHGTSHAYVAGEAARLLGRELDQVNLITLHLGNGASATAVRAGRSVDTSMGLTPLEGLVMGTRCGDIDPAVAFYLARSGEMEYWDVERTLLVESGLKGICGANDVREIQRRAENGQDRAALALDMACYRIKKYIGAYTAVLGRVDAVVFTGGVGENSAAVRAGSCAGLEGLGISLDPEQNAAHSTRARDVAAAGAAVRLFVIPTDEEKEIAHQTMACVAAADRDSSSPHSLDI